MRSVDARPAAGRPELSCQPASHYNRGEVGRYSACKRTIAVQRELAQRALELLGISEVRRVALNKGPYRPATPSSAVDYSPPRAPLALVSSRTAAARSCWTSGAAPD